MFLALTWLDHPSTVPLHLQRSNQCPYSGVKVPKIMSRCSTRILNLLVSSQPGESLEEAVRRETREEVGLEVGEIVYHSSQPWPGSPHSSIPLTVYRYGLRLLLTSPDSTCYLLSNN